MNKELTKQEIKEFCENQNIDEENFDWLEIFEIFENEKDADNFLVKEFCEEWDIHWEIKDFLDREKVLKNCLSGNTKKVQFKDVWIVYKEGE